ncbi:MAG TPA: SRPBCC family protein [Candidatus Hypogeohydataceae bacterium YC40]
MFICRWEGYATSLTKLEYGQLTVEASAPETEKWPLHVKIVLPIKAETEAVWKVLTEYDQMKEFVPHMTKCRVIEQQGNTFNVEQVYKHLLISMKLLLSIKHNHPNRIDFHLVGGNMKVYDGHWSIEPYNPGGTLLSLEVDVQPGFFAPRGIVSWILKKELPEGVMAVAEKAIKDSGKTPSPKKEEKIP